jgi:tryptophan synthase alpha chain
MSRIESTFARLAGERHTGLVTYITAGDPDPTRSRGLLVTLDRAGADVIEVGVPFSDPLADGPVIQRASERALAGGTTLASTLTMIAAVRSEIRAPIVLFSYANPIYRMGLRDFAARAAEAGVDGVLALDVPAEESSDLRAVLRPRDIDVIFLLSPTTSIERMNEASRLGSGFLYAISRLGVTGARATVASGTADLVARIRAASTLPVAVGFGVSKPEHVREIGQWAEAAVVGSALVQIIADAAETPDLEARVADYVRRLRSGGARDMVAAGNGRG